MMCKLLVCFLLFVSLTYLISLSYRRLELLEPASEDLCSENYDEATQTLTFECPIPLIPAAPVPAKAGRADV